MINLGIFGATGIVGQKLIEIIQSSNLKLNSLRLFGTERSAGKKTTFRNAEITVEDTATASFVGLDLIVSCANGSVSEIFIPKALKEGVNLVIDTDSHYRMDETVPLVMSGVNDEDIKSHKGIVASPNCSTSQLVLALQPIEKAFGIKRAIVNTYQSVSGAGKAAMDELSEQSTKTLQGQPNHRQSFAFNVIPQISKFLEDGYTKEEQKVMLESRKILHRPDLAISCTAVRVPVFVGHSEAVNIELKGPASLSQIRDCLQASSHLKLWQDPEYPMPLDVAGSDLVHVGRLRKDLSKENSFELWIVADNLLIGAATNAYRLLCASLEVSYDRCPN